MKKGIDVSAHNAGKINWAAVHGIGFVIPRIGYGEQEDVAFNQHLNGAKTAGMDIPAVYLFDYALTDQQAVQEADFCIRMCQKYGLPNSTIIFFDCEYDSIDWAKKNGVNKNAAMVQRHTRLFADRVKDAGFQPGYYANLDWMQNYYNGGKNFEDLHLWYARYDHDPEYPCTIWQRSGSGQIEGITGPVDLNEWRGKPLSKGGKTLKKIIPEKWIEEHVGKIWDIDGVAGVQCVDLYKIFLADIGYPDPTRAIGGDGYADNIWYNRHQLGLAEYFEFVQGDLEIGDIVIWSKGAQECPASHVAMYAGEAGGLNRGLIFGSNQGKEHSPGNIMDISCDGTLGALRYKGFASGDEAIMPDPIQKGEPGSIYRLYNPNTGDHLYTQSYDEARNCQDNGWKSEGITWISPSSGQMVIRLVNPSGLHHYAADPDEINGLKQLGWQTEGAAFYSGGHRPIYRMYNPGDGGHILSADRAEHDALTKAGWVCEGQDLRY